MVSFADGPASKSAALNDGSERESTKDERRKKRKAPDASSSARRELFTLAARCKHSPGKVKGMNGSFKK